MSVNSDKQNDPDPVYVLRSGSVNVTSLKFCLLDEKDLLLAGNQAGVIQFWDIETKRSILSLEAGDGASILFADVIIGAIRILVSHDRNGSVKFWDATNLHEMKETAVWHVSNIGFCPIDLLKYDGTYWIGFPSDDSNVGVAPWKVDGTKNNTRELRPEDKLGMVMKMQLFLRDDVMYVLIGYEDGSLKLWDVMNQSVCSSLVLYQDPVMALDVDMHSLKAIASSVSNKIFVVSIEKDLTLREGDILSSPASGFSALSVRTDRKIAVVGGWDGKLRIYGWKKMKLLALLKYHAKTIGAVCFSRNKLIAASCSDGRISLWDVYQNT